MAAKVILDPNFRRMSPLFDNGELERLRSFAEVIWAHDKVIVPLNETIGRAAVANGWAFVSGETQAFAKHGYCADAHWVRRYEESKALQVNHDGTLHPSGSGHNAYRELLYAAVARDFGLPVPGGSTDGGSADAADAGAGDGADTDAPDAGAEVSPDAGDGGASETSGEDAQ